MAQKSAMTGGEIAKDGVFSPSVAYGASSLITGPAGPCRAQPGVSPALGAALREPWVRSVSNYNLSFHSPNCGQLDEEGIHTIFAAGPDFAPVFLHNVAGNGQAQTIAAAAAAHLVHPVKPFENILLLLPG